MREGGRRGCRFWDWLGRLDLVRSNSSVNGEECPADALNFCLPPLLPSSLPFRPLASQFLDQHGFHFPNLQLYSFRFFLVSSADQRNLLEEGFVRHTHVHTCILFVSFHEQPTIHSQQGSALAVGLERLGTGVLHLLACSTLEVG